MQLTTVSFGAFAILALVVASILAVLQFLRIRPRRMRVITTLFWRQASEQIRARSLFERFRHPKTYLLLLAAALLMLLALAKPVLKSENRPYRVVILDAGLSMTTADGRFEKALDLVKGEAGTTAEERVAVIVADPEPRLLKHFDEGLAVLKGRLDELKPADRPADQGKALRVAKTLLATQADGELVLVTAQPVALADDSVRVLAAGQTVNNACILSATFVPSPKDPTKGEFRWRVGYNGSQAGEVTVQLRNAEKQLFSERAQVEPGYVKTLSVDGILADGSTLTAVVSGTDAIAGDSSLEFRLPNRQQIRLIATGTPAIPATLVSVADGLPGISIAADKDVESPLITVGPVGSGAQIVVRPLAIDNVSKGDAGKKTKMEMLPVVAAKHPLVAGLVFEDALCGVPSVPLTVSETVVPLLLAGDMPIAVLDTADNTITVADTFLDVESSVVCRTGYVVFWSRVLQQLARWDDAPLTLSPMQAGPISSTASGKIRLKADMNTMKRMDGVGAEAQPIHGGVQLWQLILVGALALVLLEAALNIKGRIA